MGELNIAIFLLYLRRVIRLTTFRFPTRIRGLVRDGMSISIVNLTLAYESVSVVNNRNGVRSSSQRQIVWTLGTTILHVLAYCLVVIAVFDRRATSSFNVTEDVLDVSARPSTFFAG